MLAAIDLAASTRVAVSIVLLIRRASRARVVEVSFFNADHLRSRVSAFLAGAEVAGELQRTHVGPTSTSEISEAGPTRACEY